MYPSAPVCRWGRYQFWWLVERRKQDKLAVNRASFSFSQPLLRIMIENTSRRMHTRTPTVSPGYMLSLTYAGRGRSQGKRKSFVKFCHKYSEPGAPNSDNPPCAIRAIYGSSAFVFTCPLHDITRIESVIFFNQSCFKRSVFD